MGSDHALAAHGGRRRTTGDRAMSGNLVSDDDLVTQADYARHRRVTR
jgi:hypothetical protein